MKFKNAEPSYFCPVDCDLEERSNLLSYKSLYDELRKCKAGRKLLLSDACRNDPLSATARSANSLTHPEPELPPGSTVALFACKAGQLAREDSTLKHGVFFHYVLEGLRGKADQRGGDSTGNGNGTVELTELASYTQSHVRNHVRKAPFRSKQEPELKTHVDNIQNLLRYPVLKLSSEPSDFTNSIGMKLVRIEPGEFLMGSPESEEERKNNEYQHRVRITKSFYMGAHEVTVGQVLEWLNSPGVTFKEEWVNLKNTEDCPVKRSGNQFVLNTSSKFGESKEQPMVEISWLGAVAFSEWLSRKEGWTYRLPTEAEWEYAARAGSNTPFPWGSTLNGKEANIDGNFPYGTSAKGPYLRKTSRVGSYAPNKWGLHDTVGNVWEWCSDWYDKDYYKNSPTSDPKGPGAGQYRVYRGGGWYYFARDCRSAVRGRISPEFRNYNLGFRVAAVRVIE